MSGGQPRRWPLVLIAAPAAVAVWSGWVGLGALCGFGIVHPLPGIWSALQLNTAITLPVGVEAYGAYALGAWLAPGIPLCARQFAGWSAAGSLALGMTGQVIYHLLAAGHAHRAPWPVIMLVSCIPVVTLGCAAALTHLIRVPAPALPRPGTAPAPAVPAPDPVRAPAVPEASPQAVPAPETAPVAGPHPVPASVSVPGADLDGLTAAAAAAFASELAAGSVPSIRQLRSQLRCGQDRARLVQARLGALALGGPAFRDHPATSQGAPAAA